MKKKSSVKSESSLPLHEAATAFAALGSEQRLELLRVLVRAGPEGLLIGELGERSGVTGSTLTHHLKILKSAELITQEKRGRSVVCAAVEFGQVTLLSEFLLASCCADASDTGEGEQQGERKAGNRARHNHG